MTTAPESQSQGGSQLGNFAAGLLASSLCAAFLNLGMSAFDHPGAFRFFPALFLPLALTLGIFAGAYLLLWGVATLPLRRLGASSASIAVALGTFSSLLALLWPVVAVLRREVAWKSGLVLLALVALTLLTASLAALLLSDRWRGRPWVRSRAAALILAAPLGAALALLLAWCLAYPLSASNAAARLLVSGAFALIGAGTISALLMLSARLPVLRILAGLFLLVIASPVLEGFPNHGANPPPSSVEDDRPQIVVLITVDTLRLDFVEGERAEPTPAVDSLLADSVVFENARSAAPWTKPSVATLLTGLSPLVHRANSIGVGLPEEVKTVAEYMRGAGYHTVGIGLNEHLDPSFNFHQGFELYQFPARGDYGLSFGSMLLSRLRPNRYPDLFVSTEGIADVAVDWVRSNRDKHFFLWMHILDPHWPYWPPPAFAPPTREDTSIDDFWGDWETVTNVQAGNLKLSDGDKNRVRELYRAEIRYADSNIRRLLDALKELDLYDGALIAFSSDHGEEFWEHGHYEHGHSLFDEVLRVPLAFKLPGSRFKTRIGAPVSTESLTPTLVDLLGLETQAHGFSSPSLQGYWNPEVDPDPPEALFANGTYHYGEKMMVLLRGRWKYVVEADTGRRDLYDLLDDPGELQSLASSRQEVVAEADTLLAKRIASSDGLRRALRIEDLPTVQLSEKLRARLRALGYAGSDQ